MCFGFDFTKVKFTSNCVNALLSNHTIDFRDHIGFCEYQAFKKCLEIRERNLSIEADRKIYQSKKIEMVKVAGLMRPFMIAVDNDITLLMNFFEAFNRMNSAKQQQNLFQ